MKRYRLKYRTPGKYGGKQKAERAVIPFELARFIGQCNFPDSPKPNSN